MMIGLMPVLWSSGTGADVMKRIAAPMVGGLVTSCVRELLVHPAIFAIWKGRIRAPRSTAGDLLGTLASPLRSPVCNRSGCLPWETADPQEIIGGPRRHEECCGVRSTAGQRTRPCRS